MNEPVDNGAGNGIEVRSDWSFGMVPLWLYDATITDDDGTRRLSRDAVALFGLMAGKYRNVASGRCFVSQEHLADDVGASARSIRRWLLDLVDVGALTRTPGRPGVATIYEFPPLRVTKKGRTPVSNRTPVAAAPDRDGRAARTPVAAQPEDLINQSGATTARDAKVAVAAPRSHTLDDGTLWQPGTGPLRDVTAERLAELDPDAGDDPADVERVRTLIRETRDQLKAGSKSRHPSTRGTNGDRNSA